MKKKIFKFLHSKDINCSYSGLTKTLYVAIEKPDMIRNDLNKFIEEQGVQPPFNEIKFIKPFLFTSNPERNRTRNKTTTIRRMQRNYNLAHQGDPRCICT